MLASLLPGLRDLRTPLVTGYLYFLLGFLWLGRDRIVPDERANTFTQRLFELIDMVGPGVTAAGVSFAAYLLGSILVVRNINWLATVRGLASAELAYDSAHIEADRRHNRAHSWAMQSWAEEQATIAQREHQSLSHLLARSCRRRSKTEQFRR